ncbi:MAG: hypothetical protein COA78_14700 [Blastopirellula sp.]|nr:MAG: hypothetical protein COA78_14700 [Blastopirellula sp.]
MTWKDDDFVPVTGGNELASDQIRDDVALHDVKATSDLDRHIIRLLSLHKQVGIQFRNQDLTSLDDTTKRALLDDINELLGIQPMKSSNL